jgi:ASCH domain
MNDKAQSQLQTRYPVHHDGSDEPTYRLLSMMSREDMEWNIQALLRSSDARAAHARALQALPGQAVRSGSVSELETLRSALGAAARRVQAHGRRDRGTSARGRGISAGAAGCRGGAEMKALSIRQPWAWLIVHAGKDVENRSWPTSYRGPLLIHAAKGMTLSEYDRGAAFAKACGIVSMPPAEQISVGGIVGQAELADCVRSSRSPWFMGPYGFVLRDVRPLPFTACVGRLGLFEVPERELKGCGR